VDEFDIRRFLATEYPRIVAGLTLASGSRAGAEDAVQEALARAWERSERGQRIDSLPGWVTVVATNLVRSTLRRRKAERHARGRLGSGGAERATSGPLAQAVHDRVDVERALALLTRRQREAIVLRYYLAMSVAEVADVLHMSDGAAKTTLFRARAVLSRALGQAAPDTDAEEANDHAER
jgi:RNA polymerase sigma-70 factor (ECF subfamily)